jgi:heat shock protein HtpX
MDRSYQVRNTVKTTVLLAGIGGLLVAVGSMVGGRAGAVVGLALGLAVVGVSYWRSDRIALRSAGAVPVSAAQAPQLHQMVDELAGRAGIPKPTVHLIPSAQPNAFATGRNPSHAAVAVTQGLLDHCTLDEVRGVLAHEIGHIRHRDILIGSVAAAVATGISFLANMALWFGAFNGDDRDRPSPMVTLVVALIAPIAATVLQLALSRSREFEADRAGAELLGDPEPLARALGRLHEVSQHVPGDVSPTQASAYIVNPLTSRRVKVSKLFLTHPPVEDRIARLRALAAEAR